MTGDQDNIETVLEVKADVDAVVVLPKSEGDRLARAVQRSFTGIAPIRFVELTDDLDVTVNGDTLHVTGSFYLTVHLPTDDHADDHDDAIGAVNQWVSDAAFIETVETVNLRMPPYWTQPY